MNNTFLIAEIGCNHNGKFEMARKLVDEAKKAGVDAVKFQTFKADKLISKFAPKAEYQKKTTGTNDTQLEMTAKLELPYNEYKTLKQYAESLGLIVFSTAFDMDSIKFLEEQNQSIWKIPSGELTNLPYLEEIARYDVDNKHIILSTGMATISEIKDAVRILKSDKHKLSLLHCNTEYPTLDSDMNIAAMKELKSEFPDLEIGLSDHSVGFVAAVMAVAFGATVIEKHFTLDKNLPGPDHKASATPEELIELVKNVRRAETIYGSEYKKVTESEKKNKKVARKSIVASKRIKMGEKFTKENLTCKRPGNGISPMKWYDILGLTSEKDFEEDQLIEMSGFNWQQ